MYEEDRYSDFDRLMREKLSDVEVAPPSHVWNAVSGRLKTKKYTAGWSHSLIAMASAAALVTGVIFTPRIVESISTRIHTPLMAETPQVEATTDFVGIVEMQPRKKAVKIASAVMDVPVIDESAVPEVMDGPVQKTDGEGSSAAASERKKSEGGSSAAMSGPDPLDLLAYEESRSASRRIRTDMDIRGTISSNDDIAMGVRPGRMMARSGSGSYASGISQTGEDVFGIPVSFQLGVRVFVNDWLGFGVGISYSLLTRDFTGNLVQSGVVTQSGLDILHTAQYVGVPVNIYFGIVDHERTHIYAYTGVTGEKCVSSKYDLRGSTGVRMLSEKVSGLQWSAGLGFGMQYDITRHVGLYVDPSARYYFDCAQPRTVRTSKPFMFDFAVGLRFNL